MMSAMEILEHFQALRLNQAEAAQMLGVSARTVRRWCDGEEVPGPAEAALRAWRKLSERHLAWRPDSVSLTENHPGRIAAHLEHAVGLQSMIERVEARGGPRLFWEVDIPESTATLGQAQVSFYKLQNGGFSVSVYTRRDGVRPDVRRDCALIEDATFCIAREFEKHARRADALSAIARDVRSKSHIFGHTGSKSLDPREREERQRLIASYADQIDELAAAAREGQPTNYHDFTAIRTELTKAGFSPPERSLESALAKAYVERKTRVRLLLVRSAGDETVVTKAIVSDEAHANQIVLGHALEYLGTRLPSLGESSRLHSFKGPDTVVLEVSRGASVADAQEPGLYLIRGLAPSGAISDEFDGAA
jgi:hypothetical protein